MAGNMNVAMISGRLGRNPEIRNGGSGKPIANFSVASGEYWTKDGEKKERTEWFNVVCFNDATTRFIEHYVKKGDYVRVMGRIRTRKWQDQSGDDRYSTEIAIEPFFGEVEKVMSSSAPNHEGRSDGEARSGAPAGRPQAAGADDSDIPFQMEWR